MDVRILRISQMDTDFFLFFWGYFIFRLHFWIPCDTNRCTDFTDFTDAVRIFFIFCWKPSIGVKKNPYRIREIRKIRTSICITRYPKV
jgi:hypothetical protein